MYTEHWEWNNELFWAKLCMCVWHAAEKHHPYWQLWRWRKTSALAKNNVFQKRCALNEILCFWNTANLSSWFYQAKTGCASSLWLFEWKDCLETRHCTASLTPIRFIEHVADLTTCVRQVWHLMCAYLSAIYHHAIRSANKKRNHASTHSLFFHKCLTMVIVRLH